MRIGWGESNTHISMISKKKDVERRIPFRNGLAAAFLKARYNYSFHVSRHNIFPKCTESFLRSIPGIVFLNIQKLDLTLMKAVWLKNLLLMPFVLTYPEHSDALFKKYYNCC